MNDHEQRTTALLDTATRSLLPDVDRVVAGSVARGRVLQRRRRLGTALVAAAVIGVIGTAAGATPALRGGGERAIDVPVTSPSPSGQPSAPRRIGFDVAKGAVVLESVLPAGEVRGRDAWGSDDPLRLERGARLLYEDGEVTLYVEQPELSGEAALPESMCRVTPAYACRALEDGSWLGTWEVRPPDRPRAHSTRVTLFTTDGFAISVGAGNVGDGDPVLTADQLTRIVTAPVWLDEQQ